LIKQYDEVILKSGKSAVIVEILEAGKAYIADIEIEKDDWETEHVWHDDIKSIIVKVEKPIPTAV